MDASLAFDAIGTKWRIDYAAPSRRAKPIQASLNAIIERFDQSFSRFRTDSWVSQVRTHPGTHPLPEDAYELLSLYAETYTATDGLVTPLIGTLMEQAGYDAAYSLKSKPLQSVPSFTDVVSFSRHEITTTQSVLLDFGAAGKGFLVDKIGGALRATGVQEFVINAGGDLLHYSDGKKEVTIGLENPFDTTQAIGTCSLGNGSLCASAGSRRRWENFTHIINPSTLLSPSSAAGTWVKAGSAAVADIVATALFFVDAERLHATFAFTYAILDSDMNITASNGFGLTAFTGEAS